MDRNPSTKTWYQSFLTDNAIQCNHLLFWEGRMFKFTWLKLFLDRRFLIGVLYFGETDFSDCDNNAPHQWWSALCCVCTLADPRTFRTQRLQIFKGEFAWVVLLTVVVPREELSVLFLLYQQTNDVQYSTSRQLEAIFILDTLASRGFWQVRGKGLHFHMVLPRCLSLVLKPGWGRAGHAALVLLLVLCWRELFPPTNLKTYRPFCCLWPFPGDTCTGVRVSMYFSMW